MKPQIDALKENLDGNSKKYVDYYIHSMLLFPSYIVQQDGEKIKLYMIGITHNGYKIYINLLKINLNFIILATGLILCQLKLKPILKTKLLLI